MPLLDRLQSLGLLEPAIAQTQEKERQREIAIRAAVEASVQKRVPRRARSARHGSGCSTDDDGAEDDSTEDDSSGDDYPSSTDDDESVDSDMDDGELPRPDGSDKGRLSMLGQAERVRQKSMRTQQYQGLGHACGDDDAAPGFRLQGFLNGGRVYRLDSLLLKQLQTSVVRTAVGFCYLDLAAMCPPKVVEATEQGESTRVVNGCFAIRRSALGGRGSFALRDLPRGTHILAERPLVRTDPFHLCEALAALPDEASRQAFYDLHHGHHPNAHASVEERIWTANTFAADGREAVFPVASRFNHACAPRNNVRYRYDGRHDVLVMTTACRVAAGDELLISYGKTPAMLFQRYGFRCTCGACTGFSEDLAKQLYDLSWV